MKATYASIAGNSGNGNQTLRDVVLNLNTLGSALIATKFITTKWTPIPVVSLRMTVANGLGKQKVRVFRMWLYL